MNTLHEIKNKNILNRFENEKQGTKIKVYKVITNCGKNAVLICMNGQDINYAKSSCQNTFGKNFKSVHE